MSRSGQSVRRRAPVSIEACALARAVEEIGDRWSLLILRESFFGVMRYDDFLQDLNVPRAVLTDRLVRLTAAGLLHKQPYREPGERQRFAYSLTEKGRGLAPALIAITHWSEEFILGSPGPVEVKDATSGLPVRVALVTTEGDLVDSSQVVPIARDPDLVTDTPGRAVNPGARKRR